MIFLFKELLQYKNFGKLFSRKKLEKIFKIVGERKCGKKKIEQEIFQKNFG